MGIGSSFQKTVKASDAISNGKRERSEFPLSIAWNSKFARSLAFFMAAQIQVSAGGEIQSRYETIAHYFHPMTISLRSYSCFIGVYTPND